MHRIVPTGFTRTVDLGGNLYIRLYDDGPARFEHVCARSARDVLVIAPELRHHTFSTDERGHLTIRPSILCPDCATHGFVTDNTWEAL